MEEFNCYPCRDSSWVCGFEAQLSEAVPALPINCHRSEVRNYRPRCRVRVSRPAHVSVEVKLDGQLLRRVSIIMVNTGFKHIAAWKIMQHKSNLRGTVPKFSHPPGQCEHKSIGVVALRPRIRQRLILGWRVELRLHRGLCHRYARAHRKSCAADFVVGPGKRLNKHHSHRPSPLRRRIRKRLVE